MDAEEFRAFITKRDFVLQKRFEQAEALENEQILEEMGDEAGGPLANENTFDAQMNKSAAAFAEFQRELLAGAEDETSWKKHVPKLLKDLVKERDERPVKIEPEKADAEPTMLDEVSALRKNIDACLEGKPPTDDPTRNDPALIKAACQACLLLYDQVPDAGKSDPLIAKLFALLVGEKYRSHNEVLFLHEKRTAWTKVGSITYKTLQFVTRALGLAEAAFSVLHNCNVSRNFQELALELRFLFEEFSVADMEEALLNAPKAEQRQGEDCGWAVNASKVCAALRRAFGERERHILANFHKWGATPPVPPCHGVNFYDCYLTLQDLVVTQAPKAPENNCYTSIPTNLGEPIALEDYWLLTKFLSTTFVGHEEGLELLLALLALAVRGELMPHVMLFLLGAGGEGKSLLTTKLLKAVLCRAWRSLVADPAARE